MAETTIPQPSLEREADALATIDKWFVEIDRLRAEMKREQEEIDRLRQESRENLDRIEAMIEKMAANR